MSNMDIIQLIIEIIVALLVFYLAFLKSYFQEKGKNLATKEDIELITRKVESIKSGLQFSLQAKLSWRAEEHDALVDYYSKYGAWLSGITDISFVGISDDNLEMLSSIRLELKSLEQACDSAKSRMELFVENKIILTQSGQLKLKTLELYAHAQQSTLEFAKHYLEVKQMKTQTPPDQQLGPYKELLDKETKMYKKFKEDQIDSYKALYPQVAEHRSTISSHLRQLINHHE